MTITFTHVTSERPARFVARATCPSCKQPDLGITFHGVLLTGEKVYQLAAHSTGRRSVKTKEGRCGSSDQRMQVTAEGWRPA